MQALFIEHPRIEILVAVKDGIIVDMLAFEQDPKTKRFNAVAFPNKEVAALIDDYQRRMDAERVLERMADGKKYDKIQDW